MKHVLITGGTRGIGFGLAKQFLANSCKVTITGTTQEGIDRSVKNFKNLYPTAEIQGFSGDVSLYTSMEKLWDDATKNYGDIDIWINNAGLGQGRKYTWDMSIEEIGKIVDTNIIGVINGSLVALKRMELQGHGQIYNMEGFGSDGMMMKKMTIYGTTKRAVRYFTRSLLKESSNPSILIGTISPGMVLTDLLLKSIKENKEEAERNKRVFNILADDVDTVTNYLVDKILQNKKNGAHINWLSKRKAFFRFLLSPLNKRDFFKEE